MRTEGGEGSKVVAPLSGVNTASDVKPKSLLPENSDIGLGSYPKDLKLSLEGERVSEQPPAIAKKVKSIGESVVTPAKGLVKSNEPNLPGYRRVSMSSEEGAKELSQDIKENPAFFKSLFQSLPESMTPEQKNSASTQEPLLKTNYYNREKNRLYVPKGLKKEDIQNSLKKHNIPKSSGLVEVIEIEEKEWKKIEAEIKVLLKVYMQKLKKTEKKSKTYNPTTQLSNPSLIKEKNREKKHLEDSLKHLPLKQKENIQSTFQNSKLKEHDLSKSKKAKHSEKIKKENERLQLDKQESRIEKRKADEVWHEENKQKQQTNRKRIM